MPEIRYDLIIASASRPHLLEGTLRTLFTHVNQSPDRVLIHDDAVFPGRVDAMRQCVRENIPEGTLVCTRYDDPPIGHGPGLYWLLQQAQSEYVLYSQDDHEVVRTLPIQQALAVMQRYGLHHVRFNKRATMDYKETWKGRWYKREVQYGNDVTLTVADHWYFQTSLWRVAPIRNVVTWFMQHPHESQWFHEHCEAKINNFLDGGFAQDQHFRTLPCVLLPHGNPEDTHVRERFQRTFIWGKIGEDRYVLHTGNRPEDWAGKHERKFGG
jgi:hypothetical protein